MPEAITTNYEHPNTISSQQAAVQMQASLEQQRRHADEQIRPEVEAQRTQAQQEAERTLSKEAIAAIQQTQRALTAIVEGRNDDAFSAIEQATGKTDVLLSRNPATALIPVSLEVTVIDTAPRNGKDIDELRNAAEVAVNVNDLPTARTRLDRLRSEIRVRIYHLPLATYPAALKEAARLLDQKQTREAGTVLLMALHTLAFADQVIALPLLLAREAVSQAQAQKDRDEAGKLLETAEHNLKRAMALGYAPEDSDYKALRDDVRNLRKQLTGGGDASSLFLSLKEKLASLARWQSEKRLHSDTHNQPPKAA